MHVKGKITTILCLTAILMPATTVARTGMFPQEKKDYLSDGEADKIREAQGPSDRIKLYVSFADDRLKKLQYELTRTVPERHRDDILNALINAYSGCLDDAADEIQEAKDKQLNIHGSLKLLESKSKEFLESLRKIEQNGGPDFQGYKDNLEDAIQATEDTISDARDAQKEMLPEPIRRKPS
jgi:cellobiose-specific phosphotransferase system component IIA